MPMIAVRNLTKRYPDRVAVDDLSFEVEAGVVLGFLGPNGAGKSTTLRMVTGVLSPTSGTVHIDGLDVGERPLEAARRIGYLPEVPPLYPELTVAAYLRFVAKLKGLDRAGAGTEVERVAQQTGCHDALGRVIGNLSKGYRQRVGIAQALLGAPPVIVLDEPTDGLDPTQRAEVRSLIKGLSGKHTVVLSTHLLPEVAATCDKVLILAQGRRVAFDTLPGLAGAGPGGQHASLEEIFIRLTAA